MSNSQSKIAAPQNKGLVKKLGFKSRNQFTGFMSVVLTGQLIYSCFEALKGVFYNMLLKMLHLNNAQLGGNLQLDRNCDLFLNSRWLD
ncbi:MAG: hypothetical protein LKG31_03265 [Lactobacillus sp.]|jgi:hypothetical protein|nr:hypothetical protein [Lactobacillus sp.]